MKLYQEIMSNSHLKLKFLQYSKIQATGDGKLHLIHFKPMGNQYLYKQENTQLKLWMTSIK